MCFWSTTWDHWHWKFISEYNCLWFSGSVYPAQSPPSLKVIPALRLGHEGASLHLWILTDWPPLWSWTLSCLSQADNLQWRPGERLWKEPWVPSLLKATWGHSLKKVMALQLAVRRMRQHLMTWTISFENIYFLSSFMSLPCYRQTVETCWRITASAKQCYHSGAPRPPGDSWGHHRPGAAKSSPPAALGRRKTQLKTRN